MIKAIVGQILQDDEDFLVEVVDWQGHVAVKKSVQSTTMPERVKRLQNEAYGLRFFAELAVRHPDLNVYIPKLFEASDKFIISEYIDAPAINDDQSNLEKLAKMLAGIDHLEPYGETKITPNFDYKDIRNRFSVWTEKTLSQGVITQSKLDKANQIIDKCETFLQPRIAHGDLSPYFHAFMMPKDKIALVDLEVFTPSGARYYDVARCYTRLYEKAPSTDIPKKFLSDFMDYADKIEHRDEQLLAILVQRTIGMQRDATVDEGKGDDYKYRAAELLDLVLQAKLESLYS